MLTTAKFTLAEYERMVESGAFEPGVVGPTRRRLELLRGEIVEMSPVGFDHAELLSSLLEWSYEVIDRERVRVRPQLPIRIPVSHSEPEPDIAWVRAQSYHDKHPSPEDAFLLIEVANSSLREDRHENAIIYAEAGIVDYWIVNIPDQHVEVFRDPSPTGYRDKTIVGAGGSVVSLAFPDAVLRIDELFAVDG